MLLHHQRKGSHSVARTSESATATIGVDSLSLGQSHLTPAMNEHADERPLARNMVPCFVASEASRLHGSRR